MLLLQRVYADRFSHEAHEDHEEHEGRKRLLVYFGF
jgi:hypothetical protein